MSNECLYCQAPAAGPTGFCSFDCAKRCVGDRREFLRELKLMERKVITCGVAATHPDPALTRTKKCYAETWNSPQADAVRKLRDERDELRAYRDRTEKALRELCASVTLECNDNDYEIREGGMAEREDLQKHGLWRDGEDGAQ